MRRFRFWLACRLIRRELDAEFVLVLSNHEGMRLSQSLERYWMGRFTAINRLRKGRLGDV